MKIKKILYDYKGLNALFGGVSHYFSQVMLHLPSDFKPIIAMEKTCSGVLQSAPFLIPPEIMTLQDFRKKYLFGSTFHGSGELFRMLCRISPRFFPASSILNERCLSRKIEEGDFSLYHATKAHPEIDETEIVHGRYPVVVTVHDLIPDLQGNKRVIKGRKRTLAGASHIICVSENTKNDLMRLYDVPSDKVSVIYHGYSVCPTEGNSVLPERIRARVGDQYILYVGQRKGYKNFNWFVRSVAHLLKERQLSLLCTGAAFTEEEKELLKSCGVERLVYQVCLTESEFFSVYANAIVFIYPSLYEGFGIPILDAFAAGCPVILSRCSCFPEIAKDSALYFDEDDSAALVTSIERIMDDSLVRQRLIRNGLKRVSDFSWTRCAEQTAQVYESVLY